MTTELPEITNASSIRSTDTVIDLKDIRRSSGANYSGSVSDSPVKNGSQKPPSKPSSQRSSRRTSVSVPKTISMKVFELYGFSLGAIKGPILQQGAVMYVFFFLLLVSAQFLGWAPNIRVISGVVYVAVCLCVLEFSRLLSLLEWQSVGMLAPFYLSLAPFGVLLFFSREAHIITSILFFCCSLIVHLQSGVPNLQLHVMVYIMLFILEYTIIVIGMMFFYTDATMVSFSGGRILDPGIRWGEEITFLIALGLIGMAFLLMEKFVKLYANTLLDHNNSIQLLQREKEALEKELKAFKGDGKPDLDAPIQKVIGILRSVQQTPDMDPATREQLQNVIKVLGSNQLYQVDLDFQNKGQAHVDSDLSEWLHNLLEVDKKKALAEKSLANTFELDVTAKQHLKTTRFMPQLDPNVGKQVDALLEKVEDWDFNVFEVARLTNNRPLFFVAYSLFQRHDLPRRFNIDDGNLRRFLAVVEEGYQAVNPYHNSIHAADVLQTLNYMIVHGGLDKYMTELDVLGALVSAIIHDFEHPGLNNNFQINTASDLALRYNDRSVLENYHTSAGFSLMYEDANNILTGLSETQRRELRETVVAMVLATDMAQHFELLAKFKSKLTGNEGFDPKDRKDRLMVMQIAIKCADISNPAKNTALCCDWAKRVMEEFYRQGDAERARNMPVSAFMDRDKPAEAKCQIGFIEFIVAPMYETWSEFLPAMKLAVDNCETNKQYWKKQVALEESRLLRTSTVESAVLDASSSSSSDKHSKAE